MLPFPTDSYMRALAEAVYSVAHLEQLLLGDIPKLKHAPELTPSTLSGESLGDLAKALRKAASRSTDDREKKWLDVAASAVVDVLEPRNAIVHAHPATVDDEHLLFRWKLSKSRKPIDVRPVTIKELIALRTLAEDHVRRIGKLRLK